MNNLASIELVLAAVSNSTSITLQRATPASDLVPVIREPRIRDAPPPAEHPSPPSRFDGHLKLHLAEQLDYGGSSIVYAANVEASTPTNLKFPPLVVKIARRSRRGHIAREAWFYDELYKLQGSVIPRCYGWFEAPATASVDLDQLAPDYKARPYDRAPGARPEPWSDALDQLASQRNYLSILVLERLGSKLPVGEPLSEADVDDVLSLGDSLGACHVHVVDIRHSNILSTLDDPCALPSEPSPVTKRIHHWRVIDLETCQKLEGLPYMLAAGWKSYAENLLESLPEGYIVEPWEY